MCAALRCVLPVLCCLCRAVPGQRAVFCMPATLQPARAAPRVSGAASSAAGLHGTARPRYARWATRGVRCGWLCRYLTGSRRLSGCAFSKVSLNCFWTWLPGAFALNPPGAYCLSAHSRLALPVAQPPQTIYHNPKDTHVAICTVGGICPGPRRACGSVHTIPCERRGCLQAGPALLSTCMLLPVRLHPR